MTINELRIGNYVKQDGELIAGICGNTLHKFEMGFIKLEPVTLTEEILNSCAEFTTVKWRRGSWVLRHENSQFHISKQNDRFVFRGLGMSIVYVDTVHHLQNLVYVNTLKELEIKL